MIEVKQTVSKVIKWGKCIAQFENGRFSGIDLNLIIDDIKADPEGFYAFAGAIVDELEAHKPEPEKPARKPRSDRGKKKKSSFSDMDDYLRHIEPQLDINESDLLITPTDLVPKVIVTPNLKEFSEDPEKFMREHPVNEVITNTPNTLTINKLGGLDALGEHIPGIIEIHTDSEKKDNKPKLEIHGPDGADVFIASFKDKKESGFVLPNVVKNLKEAFGGKWPDDMSAEDKKMGNDLIAGKKPETL